jgi:hypothetical protein
MITFRRHEQSYRPPVGTLTRVLLLFMAALTFTGCVQKYFTVYQFGDNRIDAEVLKEYEITPTVKASLK